MNPAYLKFYNFKSCGNNVLEKYYGEECDWNVGFPLESCNFDTCKLIMRYTTPADFADQTLNDSVIDTVQPVTLFEVFRVLFVVLFGILCCILLLLAVKYIYPSAKKFGHIRKMAKTNRPTKVPAKVNRNISDSTTSEDTV